MQAFAYVMDGQFRTMDDWGYSVGGLGSDTSHACIDVQFAVECHERGVVFTNVDMQRLANTFFDFIYRGRIFQTSRVECNATGGDYMNMSDIFADDVNGQSSGDQNFFNYGAVLRESWFELFPYYENTTISSYVVFRSINDLIDGGQFGADTLMQAMGAIRVMLYVNHEFPVNWV
jgi:hypothetical protein